MEKIDRIKEVLVATRDIDVFVSASADRCHVMDWSNLETSKKALFSGTLVECNDWLYDYIAKKILEVL